MTERERVLQALAGQPDGTFHSFEPEETHCVANSTTHAIAFLWAGKLYAVTAHMGPQVCTDGLRGEFFAILDSRARQVLAKLKGEAT